MGTGDSKQENELWWGTEFLTIYILIYRMRNNWFDSTKVPMDFNSSIIYQSNMSNFSGCCRNGKHCTRRRASDISCRSFSPGKSSQLDCCDSISQYLVQYINSLGTQKSSFSSPPNKCAPQGPGYDFQLKDLKSLKVKKAQIGSSP